MPNRRLDPPLLGLLDEGAKHRPSAEPPPNCSPTGEGSGIVIVYAQSQSFSQAVARWGAQRAETMGNATSITAVLGSLTSPTDLADLERICGQRRVRRVATHRGGGGRTAGIIHGPSVGKTKPFCGPTRSGLSRPVRLCCFGAGCRLSWSIYPCFLTGPTGSKCAKRSNKLGWPTTAPVYSRPTRRPYPGSESFRAALFPLTANCRLPPPLSPTDLYRSPRASPIRPPSIEN